jgi:para-nitrobenzyl esterase
MGHVQAFLGIPYALSPAAPRRFMAPQPPQPWTGVRAADRFANQACQIPFAFLNPALADDPAQAANRDFHRGVEDHPIPYGEDCLALNVWTPSIQGKRPVMVWLHGGGFASGSGSWGWWTGDDLAARQDVVVVTINHRLNIFGFLSLQDHGGEAQGLVTNAGMRDILMALAWVRDMIADFGGDPGNVTIFGQSGGGMKVATLMAMPSAKGLFHKAIIQSGAFLRAVPRSRAADVAGRMLSQLGISSDRLDALQSVSTEAMLAEFASANEGGPGIPRQFAPVVDGDLLPTDPFEPAAPPSAAEIPLLIGATSEEITSLQGFRDPAIFALSADDCLTRVAAFCGIDTATAQALIASYQAARPAASPSRLYAAIASDRQFGFGCILEAERQAVQAPVYAYRLTWQSPVQDGRMGAPHNLCLPLLFGRDRAPGVTGDGTAHHALSDAMQTAWARFARTGCPDHAALPAWPAFDMQTRQTMVFDSRCEVVADPNSAERKAQAALPPRP